VAFRFPSRRNELWRDGVAAGMLGAMDSLTPALDALAAGDPCAAARLLPLVYDELRQLAHAQLAQEKPGQTLDATGLVHEAYMRLVGQNPEQPFAGRRHFFAAAAEAMRRILIDNARRKGAQKRGGGHERIDLDLGEVAAPTDRHDLLAVDEALTRLGAVEPEVAELVRLRFFAKLTNHQAAELLGVSPRTADAWWAYARAWLLTELRGP
jgi:RNA polymerase sigma factor (TIGR02999 family)